MEDDSLPLAPVPFSDWHDAEGAWYSLGSGLNGNVYAIAVSGSDLYAGGSFTQAGGNPAHLVACWNGSSWSAMGGGVGGGGTYEEVHAIAASGSDVYVGGTFIWETSYTSHWNGTSWSPLGTSVNGPVYAIAVNGSDVYVGGDFSLAGGSAANNIARWDGTSWSTLGSGVNSDVYAIAVSGSDVYVGGSFSQAGGLPASRIAKWDDINDTWSALGSGVNQRVYDIVVSGSDVYVMGQFSYAGWEPANKIARWDGSSWSTLGSGVNANVGAGAVMGGSNVYAGGLFTEAGGYPANYIATWDGSSWSALGSGLEWPACAIVVSGSDVYVGGSFSQAGGIPANYIARWVPEPSGIESPSEEESEEAPDIFVSPNPMESGATVTFQSIGPSPLTIEIYDTSGRLVKTQALGTLPVGSHTRYWDGCDDNGSALTSGVYFVRLSSEEFQASTRVVLVK